MTIKNDLLLRANTDGATISDTSLSTLGLSNDVRASRAENDSGSVREHSGTVV